MNYKALAEALRRLKVETNSLACFGCGSPNTVTYNPGKDCYGPVGSTQRRTKPRKKK